MSPCAIARTRSRWIVAGCGSRTAEPLALTAPSGIAGCALHIDTRFTSAHASPTRADVGRRRALTSTSTLTSTPRFTSTRVVDTRFTSTSTLTSTRHARGSEPLRARAPRLLTHVRERKPSRVERHRASSLPRTSRSTNASIVVHHGAATAPRTPAQRCDVELRADVVAVHDARS